MTVGPPPSQRPALGAVMAVVASALFSVNGTVSKIVLEAGISSLRLVELRSAGAALCLMALAAATRPATLRATPRELGFMAIYGVTGIAFVQWLYFVAIGRLPVGIALLLEYTAPLLVALWVYFVRGQPLRKRVWAALALCLVGLSLVADAWTGFALDELGVLAGLGAAVALATYYLLGERGVGRRDPLSLCAWTFTFAGLLWSVVQPWWTLPVDLLAAEVALPGPFSGAFAPVWLLTVWIVLLGTVAPFLLVLAAIKQLGATRVGLIGMLEPVGGGLVAWVVLGEALNGAQVLGAAVVLVGIALAETSRPGRVRRQPRAVLPEGVPP